MSSLFYYGENHIFTSRNETSTIEIMHGPNEELLIHDASITSNKQVSAPVNFAYQTSLTPSDTTNFGNTGTSLSMASSNDVTYLVAGCPKNVVDIEGGVAIFSRTAGTWNQDYLLTTVSYTFLPDAYRDKYGYNVNINDTADLIAFTDNLGILTAGVLSKGDVYLYRRTGSVWALEYSFAGSGYNFLTDTFTAGNALCCKTSGSYAIIGYDNNSARVHHNNGSGSWSSGQTLQTGTTGVNPVYLVGISGTQCSFVDVQRNQVKRYALSSGTWTLTNTYNASDTIIALDHKNGIIAYCTSTNLYIINADNTQIINGTYTDLSLNSTGTILNVIIGGTVLYQYRLSVTSFFLAGIESVASCSKVTCTDNCIAVGIPGSNQIKTYIHDQITNDLRINTIQSEPYILLDSVNPIVMSETIISNLTVSGNLFGCQNSIMCQLTSTTTQTLTNNTLTKITSPFTLSVGSINTNYSIDYSDGKITINSNGLYLISVNVVFASSANGYRKVNVYVNGSSSVYDTRPTINGEACSVVFSNQVVLSTNDYLHLYALQNSGGSLNVSSCKIMINKIAN